MESALRITPLGDAIKESSVVVCAGAGGVGKTTISAALAVRAARSGRKVACLAIDPARRLATNLGLESYKRDNNLHDISDYVGVEHSEGKLVFGMLNPKELFDDIVRTRSASEEAAQRIFDNKLYRYVSNSLSGVHEYMALEKLFALREDPQYDLIVLDTPPTANAVDFFTAPRRLIEALDGKLVRVMRRAYHTAERSGFDILGRWAAIVFRTLSRFTGAEFLAELMAFIDAMSELFGSFATRAQEIDALLRSPEMSFCLVTAPDDGTHRESGEFRKKLRQLGLSVDSVVFNRAHWPMATEPPKHLDPGLKENIDIYNLAWGEKYKREEAILSDVRRHWLELKSVTVIPELPEGANRLESLDAIGDYLFS